MSKGFGFVNVGDEEQQTKALVALQGKEVDGREISVRIAMSAIDEQEDASLPPAAAAVLA